MQHKWVENYLRQDKNAEEISELELLYFIKTRENLEKNWNTKVNFTVILYNNINPPGTTTLEGMLIDKLKKNNFNVIRVADLTNEDTTTGKYIIPNDGHPTEVAWDLLTPLIAKKLQIKN